MGGFDPGWLFIIVGLVILSSGILLPAWRENQLLDHRLEQSRLAESRVQERLAHSTVMLDQLRTDQDVVRRVARADLNVVAAGDEPVLRDLASPSDVLQWLDASAKQTDSGNLKTMEVHMAQSRLELLATGPRRLWFLGAGVMCLCMGLVMSPAASRERSASSQMAAS